jgi:hypothetical protein
MEHSPLSRLCLIASILLRPGTWNTILYPDFAQMPVYFSFRGNGTQSFIHTWLISRLFLLPGTWNTVPYPDFAQFPAYSCFREHGTPLFIQTLVNQSGKMEHSPLSRLCSIANLYSCFQERGAQSLIQTLINCQSTLASWNMEHSTLSSLCSIACLLLLPGT